MEADGLQAAEEALSDNDDYMQCDFGLVERAGEQCVAEAQSYCSGCECWRCDEHDCECESPA